MKKCFCVLSLLLLTAGCFRLIRPETVTAPAELHETVQSIARAFERIQSDLEQTAAACAVRSGDRPAIRAALRWLHRRHSYAVDVSFVDARGIVQVIESPSRRKSPGARVSGNPLVKTMLERHRPMLSGAFQALDGFLAAALLYPVMNGDVFCGAVTMLLRPDVLMGPLIPAWRAGRSFDLWVMEPGGTIIYDQDPEEIGRNLVADPLYQSLPGLAHAVRSIAQRARGMTACSFCGKDHAGGAAAHAWWDTASLFGRPWRIVLVGAGEEDARGQKTLAQLGIKSLDEALCGFAGHRQVEQAIARRDRSSLLPLFRRFYASYPGLHSIQWVDENCTVRFGFPPENSLSNYRFDAGRHAAQLPFIRAVQLGRAASIEVPLLEGNTGLMHLCPVRSGGRYRGMVYYVRIKP